MDVFFSTLRAVASAVISPSFAILLIIIAIIFYRKNKKIAVMQKMIIGEFINSPLELTLSQIVLGILAGVLGSLLLSYLGVIFNENSAVYVMFIISIILMNFNSRFVCFSYSGAILGFISVLSELLTNALHVQNIKLFYINIVSLMSLIGVLHIIEGMLVMIDGSKGAVPVFANKNDKVIGGFALKRNWALPIALIVILNNGAFNITNEVVNISNWRPMLKGTIDLNLLKNAAVYFLPLYAVVGYRSITFTKSKKEKTIISGSLIMVYGIILVAVSQLASLNLFFKFAILIFAPLAHESILKIEKLFEAKGKPKFTSCGEGIMILEVIPNSIAYEMGMESGDLILDVNDKKIEFDKDIIENIRKVPYYISFKIKKHTGELIHVSSNKINSYKKLGAVLVPKNLPADRKQVKLNDEKFKDILDKIKEDDK